MLIVVQERGFGPVLAREEHMSAHNIEAQRSFDLSGVAVEPDD